MVTILFGNILSPISSILGLIMNGIYNFFHLFGIQNIALSIFVFTFITKTLMLPLNIKQQKFSRISARMNPEIQKIQAKYKGKTDEASIRKMRAEQQAVYQKYGSSQAAGCLPLLITLPILFALYSVIQNVPAYVTEVRKPYNEAATAIVASEDIIAIESVSDDVLKLIEENKTGAKGELDQASLDKYKTLIADNQADKIINNLAKYNTKDWNDTLAILSYKNEVVSAMTEDKLTELEIDDADKNQLQKSVSIIDETDDDIAKVNKFLVFNIQNTPGMGFPGIFIPLISMALSYVQGKQLNVKNKDTKNDSPAASAMSSMNVVMPIMSGFFALILPIGVGIYWIATSIYTIIQQFFVNKHLDKIGLDALIEKSAAKASNKYSKGVTSGSSLKELATKQTKSIDTTVSEKANTKAISNEDSKKVVPDEKSNNSTNPSSISEIANLLKNRNNEKGDK
ncbi:membrane protein insertase YidC [Mobilitalea sibirica]|uniref:Membrane protein insertase YidC n=1 Tax=Mobilitalea sibirica TaxID=1462919 RepID=A0A8J7L0J0_9FIRM|nr:membrane protein insertase YidC [Mobilitalea sibirica]MBH1942498.1 membrane protein insertase YidC [Mobilitalea sibirica]